jgi:protein-L-isoaspartate O-methyltransferase
VARLQVSTETNLARNSLGFMHAGLASILKKLDGGGDFLFPVGASERLGVVKVKKEKATTITRQRQRISQKKKSGV